MPPVVALLATVLFCLLQSVGGMAQPKSPASKPNIVLIVADDLGYGELSCYGQQKWQTPHLDQLAQGGVRMTDFYVPTPYCAPSRASLLTGRYPFRHGLMENPAPDGTKHLDTIGLAGSELLLSQLLKGAGYATTCIGKWHLGHQPARLPTRRGFDSYYGIPYSNDMRPVHLLEGEKVVEYPVVQASLTKRYTDRALQFMEQHQREPFFLYLAHAMPHKPLAPSEAFFTPQTPDDLYADVIRELDWSVGQMVEKLRQLGLDGQTLVIFMSDNGPWLGGDTGGLRGMKALTWEGGLRVPLIARWPGVIPAGRVSSEPCGSIDLFPTLAKATGNALPKGLTLDGKDIMPVWTTQTPTPHPALFGMYGKEIYTIRSGKWKLHLKTRQDTPPYEKSGWIDPRGPDGVTILAPHHQARPEAFPGLRQGDTSKGMLLFDLSTDPGEQHNLAEKHPQVVRKLQALLPIAE